MSKESPLYGLGKVYGYAVEGSDTRGSERLDGDGSRSSGPFRPGKTARDRASGAHQRRYANRQARSSGSHKAGQKARKKS